MANDIDQNGSQAEIDNEVAVRVFPSDRGWHVKTANGKESIHRRKALAALFAKQLAANAESNVRVVFYRSDGSVEIVCTYENRVHLTKD